ncbi:MAG: DUF5687 family protein [Bacteroidetes bacterium]|nr:DUF5687 family protein [Bacteroidota bacterium]
MIYKLLYQNKWKESLRSSIWQKNLAMNIIMGIFIFYFVLNFLFLGIFADKILMEIFPDENPVNKFNSFLLYFMGIDLIVRFLGQNLPTLSIQPYLHLPVKRSGLMHYLLGRSLVNPLNYAYFVIFIPFALISVTSNYSFGLAILWLIMLFFIVFFDNYIITYVKRQFGSKPLIAVGLGLILLSLILLDRYHIFSLKAISEKIFTSIIIHPYLIIFPIMAFAAIYYINFSFLKDAAYLEEVSKNSTKKVVSTSGISFFNRFGVIGELMNLEIKLMTRNKRPKSIIYMTPLFLLYGFFFYPSPHYNTLGGLLIFVGIFISGGFMMSYGNYLISWESSYFDALITKSFDFQKYFQAKYTLLATVTVISFLLTIPYLFFDIKLLYINTACFLFNLGFNLNLVLYFAMNNKKYLDLSKSAKFNYQGVGMSNFIIVLPMMVLPVLIYLPFSLLGMPQLGLIVLSGIGLLGIALNKPIQKLILKRFYQKKYIMAEGFRQR